MLIFKLLNIEIYQMGQPLILVVLHKDSQAFLMKLYHNYKVFSNNYTKEHFKIMKINKIFLGINNNNYSVFFL